MKRTIDDITYVRHRDIDRNKWDHCIDEALNGRIYGYAVYLDAMARHWDALVLGDYEAVMPLTWNKKWGVHYLYQPPFCAQLGVFGNGLDGPTIGLFIKAIPPPFKLIEISLNPGNLVTLPAGQLIYRNNYVLDLTAGYESLARAYKENVQRNIKKAEALGCRFSTNVPANLILSLAADQMRTRKEMDREALGGFGQLVTRLSQEKKAACYGIYSKQDELLASAVFFFSHHRMYYILPGNHPNGRTLGASHYLLDRVINHHSGMPLLLDFEGSDNPGIAFFYSSFGASLEKYPAMRVNKLPWWIRLLKN